MPVDFFCDMMYNIITYLYSSGVRKMEVRFNPINITSPSAFAQVRGHTAAGVRSVYFAVCEGADESLCETVLSLDRTLSSDERCVYNRITEFPVPDVTEAAKYGEKWERFQKGESLLPENAAYALNEVCKSYEAARGNANASIIKNLAVTLMFRYHKLIRPLEENAGKCRKLVCSGKTGYKEYLFCLMAAMSGTDVMLICPSGAPSLPSGFARKEILLSLGQPSDIQLPSFTPVPVKVSGSIKTAVTVSAADSRGKPVRREAVTAVSQPSQVTASARGGQREKTLEELAALASSVVMINVHNRKGKAIGSGSGIAIGKDGFILTNFHVAKGGCAFSVQLENDETIYNTSEIVKYHPNLDLAVLRIGRQLEPMRFGNSGEELKRGQKVVAIGSPLGLFNSVSDGIISGFREINGVEMIQFTAPISGGSSGGALLNMYGEVIGISTAGFSIGQNLNLAVGYKDIIPFISNFC